MWFQISPEAARVFFKKRKWVVSGAVVLPCLGGGEFQ